MDGFERLVRRRQMTRAFTEEPVATEVVDHLVDLARRSPSAGNTASIEFLVLEGSETARYWDVTLAAERRPTFPWPLLLQAPVLIVPWVDPEQYVARYREEDKAHTGLGRDADAWPQPYWFIDGGAAVMTLLLAAEAQDLGALFFGVFDHEVALREAFGVPPTKRALGAVAVGHRAPSPRSRSAGRPRPPVDAVVHRGAWNAASTEPER